MRIYTTLQRSWRGKYITVKYEPITKMRDLITRHPAMIGLVQRDQAPGGAPLTADAGEYLDALVRYVADVITEITPLEDTDGQPVVWADLPLDVRVSALQQLAALGEDISGLREQITSRIAPTQADLEG